MYVNVAAAPEAEAEGDRDQKQSSLALSSEAVAVAVDSGINQVKFDYVRTKYPPKHDESVVIGDGHNLDLDTANATLPSITVSNSG